MSRVERHPSLTPLRALRLLRELDGLRVPIQPHELRSVRDALEHHVAHALVRRSRRKKELRR